MLFCLYLPGHSYRPTPAGKSTRTRVNWALPRPPPPRPSSKSSSHKASSTFVGSARQIWLPTSSPNLFHVPHSSVMPVDWSVDPRGMPTSRGGASAGVFRAKALSPVSPAYLPRNTQQATPLVPRATAANDHGLIYTSRPQDVLRTLGTNANLITHIYAFSLPSLTHGTSPTAWLGVCCSHNSNNSLVVVKASDTHKARSTHVVPALR